MISAWTTLKVACVRSGRVRHRYVAIVVAKTKDNDKQTGHHKKKEKIPAFQKMFITYKIAS